MTTFYIKARPDSEEFSIESGEIPTVSVEAEAENGCANSELTSRLSEKLGAQVGIISGRKSRRKKLQADIPREEIDRRLSAEK